MNLIFAPHMDDAAISLGGALINGLLGTPTHVVCIFASGWSCLPELINSHDINLMNKKEDETVRAQMRCSCEYWEYPEAYLRGYPHWYSPFNPVNDQEIYDILLNRISNLLYSGTYQNVFFPMAIERHPDHELVYRVLRHLLLEKGCPKSCRVFLYEDLPYSYYVDMDKWLSDISCDYEIYPFLQDISNSVTQKKCLLMLYKTQLEQHDIDVTINYAESFEKGKAIERFWQIKKIHKGEKNCG